MAKNHNPAPELKGTAEKFAQMDREAAVTAGAALLIAVFFWLAIYLFKDSTVTFLSLPLWFMLSCVGGYFFSIACVYVLIKRFMRNFNLD